ncbi:hypothetical protein OHQ88_33865 (plasmid) [Micromonospora zamorensis]|uniref:hypothetical protein n=1 Tax=Micromonospora zamorensis TaxID=709883 RepID=UPI002E1AF1DA
MRNVIRKSRPLQAALLTGVALAGTLVVTTGPAQAATARCTAPAFYWGTRTCTTGTVAANSSGYFVDVHIWACSGSPWKVWDTVTGVTVASGKGAGQSKDWTVKRISGLYGSSYKARLSSACAGDQIYIENN